MPELPEIAVLASDMNRELTGRVITGVQVLQPKCLNLPEDDFVGALVETEIMDATAHGKWIQVALDNGWLLLNLGMGGEILYTDREHLPEKHRLVFDLDNGRALAINFWWFGSVHYVHNLDEHPQVSRLGPDFLSLTLAEFRAAPGQARRHQVLPSESKAHRRHRQRLRPGPPFFRRHPSSSDNQHPQ